MKPYNLIYYAEIPSTNEYMLKNISDFSDKDVLMAEIQTAGKGQFNRKWISDKPDNIYISVVLKPDLSPENFYVLKNFSLFMAVMLCKVFETYNIDANIKEPNDVLIDGKKIAGILSQSSIRGNSFNGLVLGAGVNLNFENQDLEKIDQPATSLNLLLNSPINRDEFLANFLELFFKNYDDFVKIGFDFIKNDYFQKKL